MTAPTVADDPLVEVIRDAIDVHERAEMQLVSGQWRAICDCDADLGPVVAGPLIGSSYDETVRLHGAHCAHEVLAAIAESGRLLSGHWAEAEIGHDWGIRFPNGRVSAGYVDRETRDAQLKIMQQSGRQGYDPIRRTIHTGPWEDES